MTEAVDSGDVLTTLDTGMTVDTAVDSVVTCPELAPDVKVYTDVTYTTDVYESGVLAAALLITADTGMRVVEVALSVVTCPDADPAVTVYTDVT